MRIVIALLVAFILPAAAFGQKKPKESAKVWMGVHASVRAAEMYAIRITSSQPGEADPYYAWHHNFAGNNVAVESGNIMVNIVPGRQYSVFVGCGNWRFADVHFNVPAGYSLLIGESNMTKVPRTSFRTSDYNGSFGTYFMDFELRPLDGANYLAAGYALPPNVGDTTWAISLGALPGGLSAGALRWRSQGLDQVLLDGSSLIYTDPITEYVDVARYDDGGVEYVGTPQVQVHVLRNAGYANGYTIGVYRPWIGLQLVNGRVQMDGSPYITYQVSNPEATWAGKVRIVRTQYDAQTTVDTWTLSQNGAVTLLEREAGDRKIRETSTPNSSGRVETVTVENVSNVAVTKVQRTYQNFVWGEELVQETLNPDGTNGSPLTTTYAYHDTGWVAGAFSGGVTKLKSVTRPDGSWERYEYYDDFARWGQLAKVYRPWKDGPASPTAASDTNCTLTVYSYQGERDTFQELPAGSETRILGVTSGQSTVTAPNFWNLGGVYNRSLYGDARMRSEELRTYTGPGAYLATIRTVFHTGSHPDFLGRVRSQTNPDGTRASSSYVKGDYLDYTRLSNAWSSTVFNPNTNGAYWCDTTLYGTSTKLTDDSVQYSSDGMTNGAAIDPVWLVPYKSIRRQIVRNQQGFEVAELTQVFTGSGFQLVGWESRGYTPEGLPILKLGSNASRWDVSRIAGQVNYETTPEGTQTQHFFDDLMRVNRTELKGIAASGDFAAQDAVNTYYTYDAADRVVQVQTVAGAITQTATKSYNLAGQLLSETNALGLTTSYSYANGGRTVTATLPGGATQIVDRYLDGGQKSTTGTSAIASYTSRDVTLSGAESGYLVTKVYSAQDGGPRWSQVVTDWAGRTIREEKPAFGGGLIQKVNTYNSQGRLTKVQETGMAPMLYQYNALGEVQFSGLDINLNGTLDLASTDRISEVRTKYVNQDNAWWLQTLNYVYGQDNNATPTLMGETLAKLVPYEYVDSSYDSGVAKSETRSYDVFRNLTISRSVLDRPNRLVTNTTNVSDSTADVIKVTRNGLIHSEQSAQALVTRYKYDSLRRLTETIDPRIGSSTQGYYAGTEAAGVRHQLAWVKDTANNTTSYNYDQSTGRRVLEVNPLGKAVRYAHDIMGRIVRVYGAATYPVEYEFNSYGEQTKMRTFRDTAANFAGDSWPYGGYPSASDKGDYTTWNYDAATGLLASKVDAQNRSVTYSYNTRGQLATRVWARNVTTTYAYDPKTAEQTSITYSDGTPNLVYTYTRRGQNKTVSDYTGLRTFEHCDCGKVTAELLPGFFQNREVRWMLDTTTTGAKGRTTALMMGSAGNGTNEYSVGFGYDGYGRLNQVNGVTYTYAPNSNLIGTATDDGGAWAQYRTYVPNRNLLESISTKYSAATKASFVYGHDALGRRTSNTQTGEVFASYVNQGLYTSWGYNDRSEVTSSQTSYVSTSTPMLGRNHGYNYDPIGNRVDSSVDGVVTTYERNSLNQYASRAVPNSVTATGLAPANATVNVNGAAASRQGEYFHRSVTANNSGSAVWANITTNSNLGGSSARFSFLPQTPEIYAYDNDGNITSDGRWSYTWDAENRLIAIETRDVAFNVGTPRQRFEYRYDYLGRRILKRTLNWTGPGWTLQNERRFLYDGWNPISEYNTTTGYSLASHYTWGIDLSGSLQDAGGVGGLLRVYSYETGSQVILMPAYDGNGNIYAMVDRSTGALRAIYEYSAFGETLRASGDMASRNPFRFSTKYTDDETQLLYYGFRYYYAALGRFLGRDPSSENGGVNLYAFCTNSPIGKFDVLGLRPVTVWNADRGEWETHMVYNEDYDDDIGHGTVYQPDSIAFSYGQGSAPQHQDFIDDSHAGFVAHLERQGDFSLSGPTGNFGITGLIREVANAVKTSLGYSGDPTRGVSIGPLQVVAEDVRLSQPTSISAPNSGSPASAAAPNSGGVSDEMVASLIEGGPALASKGSVRGLNVPATNLSAVEMGMLRRIGAERDPVRRNRLETELSNFRWANGISVPNTSGGPNAEFRAPGSRGPDFIATPSGQLFPVPAGASGPQSPRASGFMYTGGSGGNGLDARVTGVRFMDANTNQGPRVVYMNGSGQTVDPWTGRTIPMTHPNAHIPVNPPPATQPPPVVVFQMPTN